MKASRCGVERSRNQFRTKGTRARLRLARLIVDQGWLPARAAERYGVAWRSAKEWAEGEPTGSYVRVCGPDARSRASQPETPIGPASPSRASRWECPCTTMDRPTSLTDTTVASYGL